MDSPQQHLRRGFNWLGGAMIIAKLTDFGTILVVLRLLTKEQVGTASLVVAFGTGYVEPPAEGMPALRQRGNDVRLLLKHYLRDAAVRSGRAA